MKLLFVLDGVDYPTAANPQLALRAAGALAKAGHTPHLLYLEDGHTPLPPPPEGCRAFRLRFADERRMNEALEHGRAGGAPKALRLLRLAARPDAALAAVRMLALHRPRRQAACQKEIERLDAAHRYDAVVAVAAPYHAAFALAGAHVGGKKAAWLMDPYSQNQEQAGPPDSGRLAEETALYQAMDRVFITRLMLADYAPGGPFAAFGGKVQPLEFPALVPAGAGGEAAGEEAGQKAALPREDASAAPDKEPAPGQKAAGKECAAPGEKPGRIRCVFVGNLYPAIRTPEFALKLFCALNDPALSLQFYGGGWEHFAPGSPVNRAAAKARQTLGKRFLVCGPLPPDAARQKMNEADILLSLGNAVANQLPSKVFDYCGAGLPVLHLAVRPDDAALGYFSRWPLALCVCCQEGITPVLLEKVRKFLHSAAGQRLPFETARSLFWENTPEAVAAQLAGALAAPNPAP